MPTYNSQSTIKINVNLHDIVASSEDGATNQTNDELTRICESIIQLLDGSNHQIDDFYIDNIEKNSSYVSLKNLQTNNDESSGYTSLNEHYNK